MTKNRQWVATDGSIYSRNREMGQKQENWYGYGMNRDRKRRQELEQLDKVSLIEGYLLLEKRLARLESQMDALKQAMGVKPEKTVDNSSVPPSQGQKVNLKPKEKAKRGPKKGHIGKSRQRRE